MGIKIFNCLPTYIKNELTNSTKFLSLVKNFLCENSFYSLENTSIPAKDLNRKVDFTN